MRWRTIALSALVSLASCSLGRSQNLISAGDAETGYYPNPTALGALLMSGDTVSGVPVTVRALAQLPAQVDLSVTEQIPDLAPIDTDQIGYNVYNGWSIWSGDPSFGGALSVDVAFNSADLHGAPEESVRLFRFAFDQGFWVALPTTVDTLNNVASVQILSPGLYGIGYASTSIPALTRTSFLTFSIGLLILAVILLQGRRFRVITPLVLTWLVFLAPSTTRSDIQCSAGIAADSVPKKPIYHWHITSVDDDIQVRDRRNGPLVAVRPVNYEGWQFKQDKVPGQDDCTADASWAKGKGQYRVRVDSLVDENINGATPTQNNFDNAYLGYNCAGYGLRSSGFYITHPTNGTQAILDDEYDNKGAPDGGNYMANDIVIYKKDGNHTHVAVVKTVDGQGKITMLRSKWDCNFIYDHGLTNVPARYGAADRVWRKK